MRSISFPSGFPMHLFAHQAQQQPAPCGRRNARCGHDKQSQSRSCAGQSGQLAIFRNCLPSPAPVCGNTREDRRIYSDHSLRALALRRAVKHIQLSQFDPARLLTYVLSRLVECHGIEEETGKSAALPIDAGQMSGSSSRGAGDILRTTERRWPSRYY